MEDLDVFSKMDPSESLDNQTTSQSPISAVSGDSTKSFTTCKWAQGKTKEIKRKKSDDLRSCVDEVFSVTPLSETH